MTQPSGLGELMKSLASKGWPASERAIVYTEWRNLVRASMVAPPPNDEDDFHEGIAQRARDQLLNLDGVEDFKKSGIDYPHIFQAGKDDMQAKMKTMQKLRGQGTCAGDMEENGWCDWTQYLVADKSVPPAFHGQLREMEMDEDDLAKLMDADRLGMTELPSPAKTPSLEAAHKALTSAFEKTGFHRMEVPALDAEDPARVQALADCLNILADKFHDVGGTGVTVGQPQATLFLGIDRAGSSGYCDRTKFIGCAPKTGFPLIEVLAHEALHMHDYLMGGGDATQSDTLGKKNDETSGRLGAWARLITELHSSPDVSEEENRRQWQRADEALSDRWANMGLPREGLQQSHAKWKNGELSSKNFAKQLTGWFREGGRGDTSEFRAATVLAECELMKRASSEKPVWQQFTYEFGSLMKAKEVGVYSADYFAAKCEVVARSFQMMFAQGKSPVSDNPFASRWLVYPDQEQTPRIQAAWEAFFKDPAVRAVYDDQPEAQGGAIQLNGSFSGSLAARRSAKASQQPAPQPSAQAVKM